MSGHGTFHWNELMTNDVDAAKAFYAETIGWTYDEFPMESGTYWVIMQDGKPAGGMMAWPDAAPEGEGPRWFAHLAVDDVDARVAGVVAAGGKVLREPFDIPMVGRVAIVEDVTGASMGWITPAKQP